MREIKFIWICRNLCFNEIHRVELTDTMLLNGSFPSWIKGNNCEVIAKILPTGRNDKNGKEIYEGDIVRDFYGKILRIDWADQWARYMLSYDGENCQYYLEDYHNNKTDHLAQSMEVIGNIWENPEIL